MTRKATDRVTTIGINIGKNTFHLIGLDGAGNIALRRKLSRSQVMVRLAKGGAVLADQQERPQRCRGPGSDLRDRAVEIGVLQV
jgi:hypothetical protein